MSWNRIRMAVRSAQAIIESEPKQLASLRPTVTELLEILSKTPTDESVSDVHYLLGKIQEFVKPWRPSPNPSPDDFYIQPNWAGEMDTQAAEAIDLLVGISSSPNLAPDSSISASNFTMKIFVSHSSRDKKIAEALVSLIKTALNISSKDIRCTSVDGYKLPAGSDSNEQLRSEVFGCEVFVALLSPVSMKSMYVMFELGARWGTKRYLAPIQVAGLEPNALKAPLSGIHAISGESASDMHQLLEDIASKLSTRIEGPAVYATALAAFVAAARISNN